MSADRDINRVIRSWLNEDRHEDADRVLGAVLDQVDTTPQRRSTLWTAWRDSPMNKFVAIGLGTAAVVVALFIGAQIFVGTPPGGPPVETSLPSATAAGPTPTPLPPLGDRDPLEPGRYRVIAGIPYEVTVEVPAGWSSSDNWVVIGPRENDVPDGMAIRFYTIPNLAADPLSHAAGNLDPPVGPTVDDLVQAIVTHPGWTASAPSDITIDGYAGQLVSIAIPMDADLPADSSGRFYLSTDPGGGIWGWAPGQTFDWYIVNVDGQRLIIDAFHYPDTSEEDLAAQRAVVESVQFSNP